MILIDDLRIRILCSGEQKDKIRVTMTVHSFILYFSCDIPPNAMLAFFNSVYFVRSVTVINSVAEFYFIFIYST